MLIVCGVPSYSLVGNEAQALLSGRQATSGLNYEKRITVLSKLAIFVQRFHGESQPPGMWRAALLVRLHLQSAPRFVEFDSKQARRSGA